MTSLLVKAGGDKPDPPFVSPPRCQAPAWARQRTEPSRIEFSRQSSIFR